MENSSSIAQFMTGKTIFITGATGFLAKILVERILSIQPNINKLYLLIRCSSGKSSGKRLQEEIIETELFRVLREKWGERFVSFISERVVSVSGDVSHKNLGIEDYDLREKMYKEIDVIVNSAATTNFFDRYDDALATNTLGALHALNFAKKCLKIKAFLHISTAYVCGEGEGLVKENALPGSEGLNKVSYLNIEAEKRLADQRVKELEEKMATLKAIRMEMKNLGLERAKLHGWPNTYVFTKAMGEMILEQNKENLELIILRPTIISSTFKQPFPGWIEGPRTLDTLIVSYGKGNLKFFPCDPETVLDLIPGDMVVNFILVAIKTHANQSYDHYIYHLGSSLRNPLKAREFHEYTYAYFIKNPWRSTTIGGKLIKVEKMIFLTSMDKFQTYIAVHYLPLLKGLEILNILSCGYFEQRYRNMEKQINTVKLVAEFYKPYVYFKGIFDDINMEKIRIAAATATEESNTYYKNFNFDPSCINWEDYFMNTHLPGVTRFLNLGIN